MFVVCCLVFLVLIDLVFGCLLFGVWRALMLVVRRVLFVGDGCLLVVVCR